MDDVHTYIDPPHHHLKLKEDDGGALLHVFLIHGQEGRRVGWEVWGLMAFPK